MFTHTEATEVDTDSHKTAYCYLIPFVIYHKNVKKPDQDETSQPSLYYIVTHIYKQRIGVSTMYFINTVELSQPQLSECSVI